MTPGYFECICCGTVDIGDECLCEGCALCECTDKDAFCKDCIVDSAHGIYIPQEFARRFLAHGSERKAWGIKDEDVVTLMAGPENENYDDTWADIEGRIERDFGGKRWVLIQDGDLFVQCVGRAKEFTK